jgi:2-succinyl-6-hydroxy-2,4-cyclohexadiene-1-carboxylate synthase
MEQLKAEIRDIKISYSMTNPAAKHSIVFLHGFTASSSSWESVIDLLPKNVNYVTIDLMGHGSTEVSIYADRYRMDEQLLDLKELFSTLQLDRFSLVGYSMGGRIALAYALENQHQVQRLILESSSPGLKSIDEQQLRQHADNRLADQIEEHGLISFIDFWENISLFDSQKSLPLIQQQLIRSERLKQSPLGLANSLRGMGTGQQQSYWSQLNELRIPIFFVTGEFDLKFTKIAEEMNKLIKDSKHLQVLSVGHAIHVENPVQFATIIKEQLIHEN